MYTSPQGASKPKFYALVLTNALTIFLHNPQTTAKVQSKVNNSNNNNNNNNNNNKLARSYLFRLFFRRCIDVGRMCL